MKAFPPRQQWRQTRVRNDLWCWHWLKRGHAVCGCPQPGDWPFAMRAGEQLMRAARIAGVLLILLTTGCAGMENVSTDDSRPASVAGAGIAPLKPAISPAASAPGPYRQEGATSGEASAPAPGAAMPAIAPEVARTGSMPAVPAENRPTAQPVVKPDTRAAKVPGKVLATATPAEQPRNREGAGPAPAKQETAAPLDLKSLATRLKDTKAIGVFTKLALKNQVDDLLEQFRAYYQGRLKTTLAELRRPYELLLLKVLALLQDADPPLAGAIVASREAIWGILADPAKFKAV